MERNEIIIRIESELQKNPMLTARELCRAIHGKNEKTLRSGINSILHRNTLKFQKHSPESGKKAPRWSLKEKVKPNNSHSMKDEEICKHCSQMIKQDQEFRHVNGACMFKFS
jgi:hypothetical protein